MFFGFFLIILGIIIGSFLNSFLYRYQNKKAFSGRSYCPSCKKQIAWYDNIPILSYLLLGGKCRNCKKPISIQYPLVEALTGIVFLLIGIYSVPGKTFSQCFNAMSKSQCQMTNQFIIINSLLLILLLLIACCLLLIAIYDLKTKEIPNGFNLLFIASAAGYTTMNQLQASGFRLQEFLNNLIPFILASLFLLLLFGSIVYLSHEKWLGGGDAKFVFGMGLLLGPAGSLLAIMIASITGSIYGIKQLTISNKHKAHSTSSGSTTQIKKSPTTKPINHTGIQNQTQNRHEVPFGPFLALGTYVSLVFGPQMVGAYLRLLGL